VFDGMDDLGGDIEGVDPYQIQDLQSAPPGGGLGATQDEMLDYYAKSIQAGRAGTPQPPVPNGGAAKAPAEKKPGWMDYLTGGIKVLGEGIQAKSQADLAKQAAQIRQLAQQGAITQQSYQQMMALVQKRADQLVQRSQQTFWEKNKTWIILGAVVLVGGGVAVYFWRRKGG